MTEPTQEMIEAAKSAMIESWPEFRQWLHPNRAEHLTDEPFAAALTAAMALQDQRKDAAPLPDEIAGLIKDAEEWLKWLGETDQTHTSAIRVKKLATALRSLAQENEKLRGATPSPE